MKIALHGLTLKAEYIAEIELLFKKLSKHKIEILVTEPLDRALKMSGNKTLSYWVIENQEELKAVDFLISIGGDGTLLDAVCLVGSLETPILGLNTGRLGFLATVATDRIGEAIDHLAIGNFQIESRSLITLQ
jgi:NAD+ kinase